MTKPSQNCDLIPVGIGACLVGQPVRYNGAAKKSDSVLGQLGRHFDFRALCPEVDIGLGVPRPPIRLVDRGDGLLRAVDSKTGQRDVTEALRGVVHRQRGALDSLCGYVLVKGSPSCGYQRVKRYSPLGHVIKSDARGVFADELTRLYPLLPVEDEGRLHDDRLRESFVSRVYTYHAWKQLLAFGLTHHRLLTFYSRHKYLVMAHDVSRYRQLGRVLADAGRQPLEPLAEVVISEMMAALAQPATRRGHTDALMHIRGYLKRRLCAEEKQELGEIIEQYRTGIVPLIVPLTLLKQHFRRHPDAYIEQQVFMQPYPASLGLRNRI